ncbi:MAG: DUF2200 domain-containing protein [Oscillospiraceae bacterium]|nr:DUF2200 domain-containing protein [Oscillospiraceae bacterium]
MKRNIYDMKFSKVYPLLVAKAERKGRSRDDVDRVIEWLTGYGPGEWDEDATYAEFFAGAPRMNSNASLIKGVVCGIRVEEIEDPLMQKIRWLDKLVDEIAKGKAMEKILRQDGSFGQGLI